MRIFRAAISLAFSVGFFLAGCTTSHVIVGNIRPPTDPAHMKVYLAPPKHYEAIAVISADSNGSFRLGAQGKVDAALGRAKVDAAKLGANGLLLQALGETGSVTVGNAYTTGNSTSATTTYFGTTQGGLIKTVSVIAIYVTEE